VLNCGERIAIIYSIRVKLWDYKEWIVKLWVRKDIKDKVNKSVKRSVRRDIKDWVY